MTALQTSIADYGSTGQRTLAGQDTDELPTATTEDGTPRRIGSFEAAQPRKGHDVARWVHDSGLREIVVMRVQSAETTEYEVLDVREHEERSTTELVDTEPTKPAAIACAVAYMG